MDKSNKNNKIIQRLFDLELKDKFQEKVKRLRESLNIPKMGCKTREEVEKRIFESFKGDVICYGSDCKSEKDEYWIEDFLKEFKLAAFYKDFIENYIYYNDFFKNQISNEIAKKSIKARAFFAEPNSFYIDDNENVGNINKIYIEVNAETTTKDIDAIWPEIKEMQKTLIGYKKRHKLSSLENMEINKRMFELYEQGKSNKEIAIILRDEFNLKNSELMDYEVPSRVAEFKARKDKL